MRPSSSSLSSSLPPSSASQLPVASFYERYETMFNCGGCIVEDDEPVAAAMYQQSSDAVDEESNLTTEAISHWSSYKKARKQQESPPVVTVTYTEASYDETDKFDIEKPKRQSEEKAIQAEVAAHDYFNRITNNRNHQPNIQMAIPISPSAMMTQQHRRQQEQEHPTPIKSNRTTATPSSPPTSPKRYDMFKVVMPSYRLKDRLKKERLKKKERRHHGGDRVKRVDSDCTQDTQSMSESDGDDLSVDESLYGSEEPPPQEEDTLVSILRRKVKLGPILESKNTKTTDEKNNRVRVQFDQDTKFPDPNEIPSPTRKHVPRMSQRQRQEYQLKHYQPTTAQRQQLDLSSLLMAAAGPSLVISTYNNDEFRDYSSSQQDNACRYQKRLARRAQQKQYQYHSAGNSSQYRHTSSSAAEELLSHYYNQNEDVASFYAFR